MLIFFVFLKRIFLMSIIFKDFIEFVTILLLGFFNFFGGWGQGMWDLGSPIKNKTSTAPTALDKHFKDKTIVY